MKNTVIYAHRSSVVKKDGDVFIADLIGLPVIDANTGKTYGIIAEVEQSPASDIYKIRTENGYVLLPAVKEFVKEIDIERGVYICPIPGFFDEI